jgi:hypothetical protein
LAGMDTDRASAFTRLALAHAGHTAKNGYRDAETMGSWTLSLVSRNLNPFSIAWHDRRFVP